MSEQFGLQGVEALTAKFGAINYDVKFKGGRFALRKAANIIVKAAKQGALSIDDPKTSEKIYKNLVTRFGKRRFKATGDLQFRVGVLGGAQSKGKAKKRKGRIAPTLSDLGEIAGQGKNNPGGDTFYWRFIEFGGENTTAHPFMRPALENNTGKATNEFISQYKKSIDRAIKKASRVKK